MKHTRAYLQNSFCILHQLAPPLDHLIHACYKEAKRIRTTSQALPKNGNCQSHQPRPIHEWDPNQIPQQCLPGSTGSLSICKVMFKMIRGRWRNTVGFIGIKTRLKGVPYTTQSDERDRGFVHNLAICTTVDNFRRVVQTQSS